MSKADECVYPSNYDSNFAPEYGLTKREYFAAMAMQGYCTTRHTISHALVAEIAVAQADALLKELEK